MDGQTLRVFRAFRVWLLPSRSCAG